MPSHPIKFLVFDVESVADGDLVSRIRYPGQSLNGEEAIAKYRAELWEKYEHDFIPYTFQIPVAVSVAKVDAEYRLLDAVVLDPPQFRPHVIAENFWRGWNRYGMPTLVSFNGRSFDLPLLELAAFRYGISIPAWFNLNDRAYDQKRNRYNLGSHFDIHDFLTNFGASRFQGGLNLAATLLGKPGKMDVAGHMVQDMFNAGQLQEINDYCRCDVLDTYFVFLRSAVLMGQIDLQREQELVESGRRWLQERVSDVPIFETYLSQAGHWDNPWTESESAESPPVR